MPPLVLPEGVPPALALYALWISIHGILIIGFSNLSSPRADSNEHAKRTTKERLSSLNTYLWDISTDLGSDPYDGPLKSVDDLSTLLTRARDAYKPMLRLSRLQKETARGKVVCVIGIVLALILGGLYWLQYPSLNIATTLGKIGAVGVAAWTLWYIIHSVIFCFSYLRAPNEDE